MLISVTVKLKLDFSLRNKLKSAAFISLYSLLVTPTNIGANSRFSDNCKRLLRADKSNLINSVNQLISSRFTGVSRK